MSMARVSLAGGLSGGGYSDDKSTRPDSLQESGLLKLLHHHLFSPQGGAAHRMAHLVGHLISNCHQGVAIRDVDGPNGPERYSSLISDGVYQVAWQYARLTSGIDA
jgi:hypothetical protein